MLCQECKIEFNQNPNYRRKEPQKFCSQICRVRHFKKLQKERQKPIKKEKKKRICMLDVEQILKKVRDRELEPKEQIILKLFFLSERQQNLSDFLIKKSFCEVCGKKENLVVHHVCYSPIEIMTLCASCHSRLHFVLLHRKRVKPKPITFYPLAIRQPSAIMALCLSSPCSFF